jgi:translocation and assembly module TamB
VITAILKSTLRITLTFLVGALVLIYFLGNTTAGLKASLELVALFSQGQIYIGDAQGQLFSQFTLSDVNYHSADAEITLSALTVEWDLKQIPNKLILKKLLANDLTVKTHENEDDKSKFDFKRLAALKHVNIRQVQLKNFTFIANTQPAINFENISLQKTGPDTAIFYAKTLGGDLNGSFTLSFGAKSSWAIHLNGEHINPGLQWHEWPGDIAFSLNTQGHIGNTKTGPEIFFQLSNLDGQLRNYPLHGYINFVVKNQQLNVQDAQLSNGNAKINFNGSLTDNWNLNWKMQLPDLTMFMPRIQGSFSGEGTMRGARNSPTFIADLVANKINFAGQTISQLNGKINVSYKPDTPFAITLTGYGIKIHDHALSKIDLGITGQAKLIQDNVVTQLAIAISNKPYINAQISVPKTINSDNLLTVPVQANMAINFPDLATLKGYLPAVTNLTGILRGKMRMDGALSRPTLNGEITLTHGNATITKLGTTIKNINLTIIADASKKATYQGNFQLGAGMATLQGQTNFNYDDYATELHLQGSNLQIVNLTEYKISATPDLKLHFRQFKVSIDGNITIPEAKISPKDFRQTVTLPDDIVYVGAKESTTAASLLSAMPAMQISVNSANHIFLHYQDLETTLGGNLTVQAGPNSPATAVGSLVTSGGTYKAYGQVLKIQLGHLTYTGGLLTNPGLNIKATRDISTPSTMANSSSNLSQSYFGSGTLTVGVQIAGTLNKPAVSLFSIPAGLGQDDILSYLVLGIPRSQASVKDSLAILNATSSVGLGGGSAAQLTAITKKLQDGLGLAEMNVESVQTFDPNAGNTIGTTSLVLGKAISKKLYVHYSVSLFSSTPVSILNLRYKFNKHWSVQTETSTIDNGADILYSIERN